MTTEPQNKSFGRYLKSVRTDKGIELTLINVEDGHVEENPLSQPGSSRKGRLHPLQQLW